MNEHIQKVLEEWAREKAWLIGGLSFSWIFFIIVTLSKHFKTIADALPSIQKFFKYVHRQWFRDANFKKDLMERMDRQDEKLSNIQHQVNYNGGGSLKDTVTEMKDDVKELTNVVYHNKALRDITDLCSDKMLFKVNDEGACTFINDAFLKFFGWQESDVLGFNFENLIADDDVPEMRRKWQKAIDTKTQFRDEQQIKTGTGTLCRCLVKAYPIVVGERLIEFSGTIELLN